MKRPPTPVLDFLSTLEAGRPLSHPVDYLRLLHRHRPRLVTQAHLSRIDALIADAREAVLRLAPDELYGVRTYAEFVQTPEGPDVEMAEIPELWGAQTTLRHGDLLVLDTHATGLHYRNGARLRRLMALTCRLHGTIAYPPEGGPPTIPRGEERVAVLAQAKFEFDPEGRLAPPFSMQTERVRAVVGRPGVVLVSHNALSDVGFLNAEFARCGLPPISGSRLDTRPLCHVLWPRKRSLGALADRTGVGVRERADCPSDYGDALVLGRCLPGLLDAVSARIERDVAEQAAAERKTRRKK